MSEPQTLSSRIGSRVLLSFLSAFAGWIAGVCLLSFIALIVFVFQLQRISFSFMANLAFAMGIIVLIAWASCLLPVCFLASNSSKLWRPVVLSCLGALTGILLMFFLFLLLFYNDPEGDFSLSQFTLSGALFCTLAPALIGGVAGYAGAVLHNKIK